MNFSEFAIAGCLAQSNETTLPGRSLSCKAGTRKRKTSGTSEVDSTSKGEGCYPYWTDYTAEKSSRLWLPTETVLRELEQNSSLCSSNKTVANSWFSTRLHTAPRGDLRRIFSPSSTSSLRVSRDCVVTVTKSRRIRIYPTAQQRAMIRDWHGAARYVYNQCIEYLDAGNENNWAYIKANMKELFEWKEWLNAVPYKIKGEAVRDACMAVKTEKRKAAQTGQPFHMKWKSRKHPKQSCFIPKTAVKEHGIYVRKLKGRLLRREELPSNLADCRLVLDNGCYYLVCPYEERHHVSESQGRVVALDPGIRSFLTIYSESVCGWVGRGDFGRIQRLCAHLDDVLGQIAKAKGRRRQRLRKAAARARNRIKNLIDELHHKTARLAQKILSLYHYFSVKISRAKLSGRQL